MKRIGLITSGGDCPGLNAVIRAVLLAARQKGIDIVGLPNGVPGLISNPAQVIPLDDSYCEHTMLTRGGSRLGGFIKSVYQDFDKLDEKVRGEKVTQALKEQGINGVIATGGDGTFAITAELLRHADMPFVGIPKTIDNDVPLTNFSIGFQSAVSTAATALRSLVDTASSHRRVIVGEVMGRDSGYLPLHAGLAAGVDAILLPEFSYEGYEFITHLKAVYDRQGYAVVAVSESVALPDGSTSSQDAPGGYARYGGSGEKIAHYIYDKMAVDARHCVLGHTQRGGMPTAFDINLATILGAHAIEAMLNHSENGFVKWDGCEVSFVALKDLPGRSQQLAGHVAAVRAAQALGVFVGNVT